MLKLGAQICVKTLLSNYVKPPLVETAKKGNFVLLNAELVRKTSFFSKISREQLWKGVLSVSNAGKRKGRGKRDLTHKKIKILDKKPGEGQIQMSWPGLNAHVLKESVPTLIKSSPKDDKTKLVAELEVKQQKSRRVHPLDRGWSGRSIAGKKIGPPAPFENQTFDMFESVVLLHKSRAIMTSIFGKRRKFTTIVATGNGNGLLGLAVAKNFDSKNGIRIAQIRASKKLLTIDLIDKHTVNHDFYSEYGSTRVFVFKKPPGFGLRCHRVITAICKLIGIENLSAKVEGTCNILNIIRAFVVGLLRQKTYQQIADEKKLHLVEFKEESCNFPTVLATPKEGLTLSQGKTNPYLFNEYIMGNRVLYKPDKKLPFYTKFPSWQKHLKRTQYHRNHDKVKIDLLSKYGSYQSHLTAIYPECTSTQCSKQKENHPEGYLRNFKDSAKIAGGVFYSGSALEDIAERKSMIRKLILF